MASTASCRNTASSRNFCSHYLHRHCHELHYNSTKLDCQYHISVSATCRHRHKPTTEWLTLATSVSRCRMWRSFSCICRMRLWTLVGDSESDEMPSSVSHWKQTYKTVKPNTCLVCAYCLYNAEVLATTASKTLTSHKKRCYLRNAHYVMQSVSKKRTTMLRSIPKQSYPQNSCWTTKTTG